MAGSALSDDYVGADSTLNGSPGLYFSFDENGTVIAPSQQLRTYVGTAAARMLARWPTYELIHSSDAALTRSRHDSGVKSGAAHRYELRLKRADGIFRWFQLQCAPSDGENGAAATWQATLAEIEDIQQERLAALDRLRSMELLVDSMPGLLFTTRPTGELEWTNRTIQAYFGKSLEELQEWQMTDVVHPDDLPNTIARWQEGTASGQPYDFEERLLRHDGVYRWFQFRAAPLKDENGQIFRWVGLVTDIDDMKAAKEKARLNERHLRLILDNIPGFVYTLKPSGAMEQVNRQILDFFGKSFDELQDWTSVTHPDDIEPARRRLEHAISTGTPWESEARGLRADGVYRWFHSRGLPLRDTDGTILRWYCVNVDIDDRKRAEEDVRRIQSRLAKASQLAAVSEFSASIAHEINQPLAALIANGDACRRWLSMDPPNLERALASIERTIRDGKSAADIISRIRSLFRQAQPEKQALNVNFLIEEVSHLISDDLTSRGILLTLNLQADLPAVSVDRVQLQQVIANLARNAIEAMESIEGRKRHLGISTSAAAAEVTVRVVDSGEGLKDPDVVFEPFFTTKRQGLGMGLSICKTILEAHGGRLWADQNSDCGATFAFALPVASVN